MEPRIENVTTPAIRQVTVLTKHVIMASLEYKCAQTVKCYQSLIKLIISCETDTILLIS